MNLQQQQQNNFCQTLADFLIYINLIRPNQRDKFQTNAKQMKALKIYKLVCRRGGYRAVNNRKQWNAINTELQINNLNKLKDFYYQYIYPYQQKYYFGKQLNDQLPNMICTQPRKMLKIQQKQPKSHNQPNQLNNNTKQSIKQQTGKNLQEQIKKKFQQEENVGKIFYLNKNKLNQTKAQLKRIAIGLQSYIDRKDVIYSLNMLLIYSVNTTTPFILEANEKLFNALSNYINQIYPPKNEQELQNLRMVTLIFRNFTLHPINLKFILSTQIFQTLVKIFNQGCDKQCSQNIIDIMSGLVKVGWDCKIIMNSLSNSILNNQIEVVQNYIQLLRGLVDERQDGLATIITQNIQTFNRILLNNSINIQFKEQIFQILAFVTDSSSQARQLISKNIFLIGIIVGVLQNMRKYQKLTQLAALTLSNISNAMSGKNSIKQFENQLIVIGFSDDNLAGILANILAEISTV